MRYKLSTFYWHLNRWNETNSTSNRWYLCIVTSNFTEIHSTNLYIYIDILETGVLATVTYIYHKGTFDQTPFVMIWGFKTYKQYLTYINNKKRCTRNPIKLKLSPIEVGESQAWRCFARSNLLTTIIIET